MSAILAGEGLKAMLMTLATGLAAFLSLEALAPADPQGVPREVSAADVEAAVRHADAQRAPSGEIFVPAHWER